MDSKHMATPLKERILEELKECSAEKTLGSHLISEFRPRDISTIDINGRLAKEVANKQTTSARPSKRVSFPGVHLTSDSHKRSRWMMIRDLYRCTHAKFSWEHLDRTFTQNSIITRFVVPDPQPKRDNVVNCTVALLKRLPPTPLPLPSHILQPTEELIGECWLKSDAGNGFSWEQLSTVSRLSSSVIRMGIAIAVTYERKTNLNERSSESHNFRQFLDFISDLIDGVFFELEKGPIKKNNTWVNNTWRWFALLTYLWSTWQRCLALHYWRVLQDSLQTGFDYTGFGELGLRPNRGSFLALELQQTNRSQDKLQYMCNLAYQILQRSRSTSLLDLRHFHQRFIQVFGERPGRCVGNQVCSGLGPDDCKRIRGGDKIEDQSQHDHYFTDAQSCNRMEWNKASYLEVSGPRAVSISSSSDQLCYKLADTKTLAISHVWLHGQGGRPEDGMNECLHSRYCKIAEDFGCSSYWIDAACIPDEHVLRKEAISTINQVFSTSHATILCDKDLMDIDISIIQDRDNTPASIALQESILAIVLVCDWNVRAWTLLEALRGRKNIQLLCKSGNENKLISLTEILRTVAFHGDITISILLLTNHHLFPPPSANHWIKAKTSSQELSKFQHIIFDASFDASIVSARIDRGFVAVSEAASLLGQRFASRPGDDVIIWSLLVDDPVMKDAQDLWARGKHGGARLDSVVHTSHLLSSVQRLNSRQGPSWAPRQPGPYLAANEKPPTSKLYPPYDGIQSQIGLIEIGKNGDTYLRANWGVAAIHFKDGFASHYRSFQSTENCLVDKAVPYQLKECLKDYKEGILLQPLQREAAQGEDVKSYEEPCASIYGGYGGVSEGLVFAVCGRKYQKPGDGTWTWLGIIDWGKDNSLPYFEEREIILD